ncbi:DUF1684 domain-containing protein [Flavobacteriaceae bacterium]|nr:hypothetical protein [Flavobacteriaceae bacterium]MDC1108983.1 DUF1684 domain-containing protein [Flavobacteriaceae bacterium]RZO97792.1 MAG: DUF1684 domain-containing protein [Flavobacteriales bacterium]|tara:strand:- start:85 stop:684 length:600 start_codon:yes stop_codon:yes gene_type:complete
MKNFVVLIIIYTVLLSCKEQKRYIPNLTEFQKELNASFKDVTKSPLAKNDRQNFVSLDFFDFDSSYVVKAVLIPSSKDSIFNMKTNTDRMHSYNKYGKIKFKLNENYFELNVYKDNELITDQTDDELFLPFYDNTNGITTYSGGRYIDLKFSKDSIIYIDFNKAYNPYCVYNYKFSCPIVPSENYLELDIRAGVKDFKK